MSTRCIVGELESKEAFIFNARYCHSDGYLEGVGETIIDNWKKIDDTQKMVDFLLSSKKGWAGLCGTDFTKAPQWETPEFGTPEYDAWDAPRWYDDRPGEEIAPPIRKDSDLGWLEFAYLFHVKTNTLHIYEIRDGNLSEIKTVTLAVSD